MELSPLSQPRDELYSPQSKNQLIVAGAGSGKTYTLVNTVAERISNGTIDPLADDEKVVIFTFTTFFRNSSISRTPLTDSR